MKLYEEYLKEIDNNRHVYYDETGFATYNIVGEECYIEDIYVKPEFRRSHKASKIADKIVEIAKERQCKYLTGSVIPSAANAERSLKVLLGYGLRLEKAENNIIWFIKEI